MGKKKADIVKDFIRVLSGKEARIGVMGMGYVGLPLALELAKSGASVMGFDPDLRKVESINKGKSYISDIPSEQLSEAVKKGTFRASDVFSQLSQMDAVVICVPTPLSSAKDPDVEYIRAATREIAKYMSKTQLVVLESTTYPGTTEEVVLPILEANGKKYGRDFFLAFSPERVDPGNPKYTIHNTPKIIGGMDDESTEMAKILYGKVLKSDMLVPVSCPRTAEMAKLLENIFRSVNIALTNELALLCDRMGIDIWEVIDAASTKPFGYMPFYPGPGVGGHCIPVDPYYLSWKAREYDFYAKFIEHSAEVNLSMPRYVVTKITEALNQAGKSIKNSRILALGVSFKANINDARNSPAMNVVDELLAKGANLDYSDPHIPEIGEHELRLNNLTGIMKSVPISAKSLKQYDAVVILVNHSAFNMPFIVKNSRIIVDTRNACKGLTPPRDVSIVKI